jgi:hypothetical protein
VLLALPPDTGVFGGTEFMAKAEGNLPVYFRQARPQSERRSEV